MTPARVHHMQIVARTFVLRQHGNQQTRLKVEPGNWWRQQCNPEAGHCGPAQRLGRVAAEPAGNLYFFLHTIRPSQTPSGEATGMTEAHAVVVHQVLQGYWDTAGCDVLRAGHHAVASNVQDLATDVARVMQWAAAKSHVDPVGNQVGLGIPEDKVEPYSRMSRKKTSHPLHLEKVEKIGGCRHPHQAAGLLAANRQRPPSLGQSVNGARAPFVERLAGTGEFELTG